MIIYITINTIAIPIKISFNLIVGFNIPQYGHLLSFGFISLLQFLQGSNFSILNPLKFF